MHWFGIIIQYILSDRDKSARVVKLKSQLNPGYCPKLPVFSNCNNNGHYADAK